ncbi:MAG TPA: hypothetical protein VK933_17305, partial [Longimicrobiales bacterium]|nr:hypothetical protein [Longimicrobiales bacterium]
WLRVAHSGGRIAYQRAPLVHHRVHDASLTAQPLQLPRGALRVLEKALRELQLTHAERAAIEWRMAIINADLLAEDAKRLLLAGDYRTAHERMQASAHLVPTRKRKLAALCIRWTPWLARQALQARR